MQIVLIKVKKQIIFVFTILFIGSIIYGFKPPADSIADEKYIIEVKPGMGAREIGDLLYDHGVINSVLIFQMVSKMQGLENSLQAGEFVLRKNMPVQQIIAILTKGENDYQQITIPEGYTVEQVATLLQENHLADGGRFKNLAKMIVPYSYMANDNPRVVYKVEGYMFPNTYRITNGATEEQILMMMVKLFDQQFTTDMRARATAMGLSIKDVIILASLVEKEAQLASDRPLIAGVFLNRLKQDMPLQSCATIQYILGYPKPELTVQDTEISSAYNTYQHRGLPPGPIANPGIAAINAVLYPEKTAFLYFVADKQGAHHFSTTYDEHLIAIEQVSK